MELLGSLGIDIKLLIAQLLNFGLLLWILTKFFYKPVLERIEHDEERMKSADAAVAAMDKKQTVYQADFRKEKAKAMLESKKILNEATATGERLKQEALDRAQREATILIERMKKRLQDEKGQARLDIEKALKEEFSNKLGQTLKREFSPSVLDALNEAYLVVLAKKIAALSADEFGKGHEARLEFARRPDDAQLEKIRSLLTKKLGSAPAIRQHKNERLLSGFRLVVAGTEISCNLSADIKYATKQG